MTRFEELSALFLRMTKGTRQNGPRWEYFNGTSTVEDACRHIAAGTPGADVSPAEGTGAARSTWAQHVCEQSLTNTYLRFGCMICADQLKGTGRDRSGLIAPSLDCRRRACKQRLGIAQRRTTHWRIHLSFTKRVPLNSTAKDKKGAYSY